MINNFVYELPHKLSNDIRHKDLRNLGNFRKISKFGGD